MEVKHDFDLSKKTTFHVGGIAQNFYIPENQDELLKLIESLKNERIYIISAGSNLLINDNKIFTNVVSMERVDNSIFQKTNDIFYVGCSNRIQKVIREINKLGYGGFEELFCIPALFGGIIYMNAGIGSEKNKLFTISDFILKVKVVDKMTNTVKWLKREDCDFSHRMSVFQNDNYIVLGAEIKMKRQNIKVSNNRIDTRIKKCRENHEWGRGCFGTCFSKSNRLILKITSFFFRPCKKVYQSKKNCNWLVNGGNGKYKDAKKIIDIIKKTHRIFHLEVECEVKIWE